MKSTYEILINMTAYVELLASQGQEKTPSVCGMPQHLLTSTVRKVYNSTY